MEPAKSCGGVENVCACASVDGSGKDGLPTLPLSAGQGKGFCHGFSRKGAGGFLFYPYNPRLMLFSAAKGAKPRVASLWDNQAVDLHCMHYTRA